MGEETIARLVIDCNINSSGAVAGGKKAEESLKNVKKTAEKTSKPLGKILSSFGRIAFYRAIRSVLSGVTGSFKEGITNMYQFSKMAGTSFASSMDKLSTSLLNIKNSLGAAIAPIIESVIVPAVEKLTTYIMSLCNAIARFNALILGQKKYTEATTGAVKKYASAVAKTILGFDELNRLNGGSSSLDYSSMFSEKALENLTEFEKKLQDFSTKFRFNIDDVLFNWNDLSTEQIAKKVIAGLGGIIGAIMGFHVAGVPGAIVFSIGGVAVSLLLSTIMFDNDGVISAEESLSLISVALTSLVGGIIGFKYGGKFGSTIGATVGAIAGVYLTKMIFNADGKASPEEIANLICVALFALAGGIVGFSYGQVFGASFGIAIGAGIGITISKMLFNNDGVLSSRELANAICASLGALVGGVIGFTATGGNVFGAFIGIVIGAGVTLKLLGLDFDNSSSSFSGSRVSGTFGSNKSGGFAGPRADGGFVNSGDLFIAREAGPELVGSIGSKTAVMNNDQIVSAVSTGVYNAVVSAMGNRGGENCVKVYLDSKEIRAGQKRLNKALG